MNGAQMVQTADCDTSLLGEIDGLRKNHGYDDQAPTKNAISKAHQLISDLFIHRGSIPDCGVFPLDGGIYIDWCVGDRHVHLFIDEAGSEKSFVVEAEMRGSSVGFLETVRNPDWYVLNSALCWLEQ